MFVKPLHSIVSVCYHCGNDIPDKAYHVDEKYFCCNGCKMVFEILNEHQLCDYYELNEKPGLIQNRSKRQDKYAFLEDSAIQKKLIKYADQHQFASDTL